MASSHPRLQSTSAMAAERSISAAKRMVMVMSEPLSGTRLTGAPFLANEPPAVARQTSSEPDTAQLADQFRRYGPGVTKVIPRHHVSSNAPESVSPQRRTVMDSEIVVANRMRRRRAAAMVAVRAEPAGGELEMTQHRVRSEPDLSACGDQTQREVGLEAVTRSDEVFVEASGGDGVIAFNRKIAGHHVGDKASAVVAEMKFQIILGLIEVLRFLARLKDLSDHRPFLARRVRPFVGGDQ